MGHGMTTGINTPDALRPDMANRVGIQRLVPIALLCWLAMVGLDFFLHGGLLAAYWVKENGFLLAPSAAFSMIPAGYAAILLLATLLLWLMVHLAITGAKNGFIFGLQLGALVSGALCLALLSATTAELPLLLGWFAGQSVEMAVGGAVIGSALGGERLSRLLVRVVLLSVGLAIITIALQSVGLAPVARL